MKKTKPDIDQQIDRAFGILAFTVNRHLIEHMRRIALELEMDFESAYLYGILAHMNVAPAIPLDSRPADVLDDAGRGKIGLVPVRLTDIAQVSGLPRETVRRKLETLQQKGKAERTPDGLWQFCRTGVDEHIHRFTKETILRFLKTADEMHATLDKLDLPK